MKFYDLFVKVLNEAFDITPDGKHTLESFYLRRHPTETFLSLMQLAHRRRLKLIMPNSNDRLTLIIPSKAEPFTTFIDEIEPLKKQKERLEQEASPLTKEYNALIKLPHRNQKQYDRAEELNQQLLTNENERQRLNNEIEEIAKRKIIPQLLDFIRQLHSVLMSLGEAIINKQINITSDEQLFRAVKAKANSRPSEYPAIVLAF